MRTNLFNIVLSAIFLTIGISKSYSQEIGNKTLTIPASKQADSTHISIPSLLTEKDSTKADTVKKEVGYRK